MNQTNEINDLEKRWQICFDVLRREGTRRVRHHSPGWDKAVKQMISAPIAKGERKTRKNASNEWSKRLQQEAGNANAAPWGEWNKRLSRMIDTWYFRPPPSKKIKQSLLISWSQSLKRMVRSTRPKQKSKWERRFDNWRIASGKRTPSYARPKHPQKEAWSKCFWKMIKCSQANSLSNWDKRLNELVSHANRKFEDHNKRLAKVNRKAELQVRDNGQGIDSRNRPA